MGAAVEYSFVKFLPRRALLPVSVPGVGHRIIMATWNRRPPSMPFTRDGLSGTRHGQRPWGEITQTRRSRVMSLRGYLVDAGG